DAFQSPLELQLLDPTLERLLRLWILGSLEERAGEGKTRFDVPRLCIEAGGEDGQVPRRSGDLRRFLEELSGALIMFVIVALVVGEQDAQEDVSRRDRHSFFEELSGFGRIDPDLAPQIDWNRGCAVAIDGHEVPIEVGNQIRVIEDVAVFFRGLRSADRLNRLDPEVIGDQLLVRGAENVEEFLARQQRRTVRNRDALARGMGRRGDTN